MIGLKRTGKSCRLRWVNYLHPGLKRGKMTAYEERLVLELHSKWGNRWSRIARKLPGRTDNEIKNYWRTHMRKEAQEKKKRSNLSPSSSHSNCSSSSSASHPTVDSIPVMNKERNFYDTGGLDKLAAKEKKGEIQKDSETEQSMDEIWDDICLPEDGVIKPVCGGFNGEVCGFSCPPIASPLWDFCPDDSLWMVDQEEIHHSCNKKVKSQSPIVHSLGILLDSVSVLVLLLWSSSSCITVPLRLPVSYVSLPYRYTRQMSS